MKTKTLKTILASAILFSVLIPAVSAQDTLYLKDGSKLEVRIGDITDTKIEFRKYGSTDLDFYYIDRMDALKIHYDNGDVRNFGEKERVVIKKSAPREYEREHANIKDQIQIKHSYWNGGFNLVDSEGRKLESRVGKRQMLNLLAEDPEALNYYRKFRKNKGYNSVFVWGGLGISFIGAGLMAAGASEWDGDAEIIAGGGILAVGLCTTLIGGISTKIMAHSNAYKAANSFNRNNSKFRHTSIGLGATKHGLGLVLKF